MLLLFTVAALVFSSYLDTIRARLLSSASAALEKLLGPRVLGDMVRRGIVPGSRDSLHGLRDVSALRVFLTGPGIVALFDAPWAPIYVVVISLFHPVLGGI